MLSMQIKTNANLVLLFALFLTPFFVQAKDSESSGDLKTEIKEYISHHLEDAYDFSLFLIPMLLANTFTSESHFP